MSNPENKCSDICADDIQERGGGSNIPLDADEAKKLSKLLDESRDFIRSIGFPVQRESA